jgi:arylsulfatase A-like enzyme
MDPARAEIVDANGSAVPASVLAPTTFSSIQVLFLATWFGLVAGLAELLLLACRVRLFEKGFLLRSRHFLWMVPVSDLAIFAGAGVFCCLWTLSGRRVPARWVLGLFACLLLVSQLLIIRGLNLWGCGLFALGLAVQTSRRLAAQSAWLTRVAIRTWPALFVVLVGLIIAPHFSNMPRSPEHDGNRRPPALLAPNILLIVLDTVRADHLGLYGYDQDTTPNLSRLAQAGVRFDLARATAPWTLPSHASLFTGRWPHELGVEKVGWLDSRHATLAEYLGARGYETAGFIANTFFCGHESGLSRGFQSYSDFPVTPSAVLRSSSIGWLLSLAASRTSGELHSLLTGNPARAIVLDFDRKDAAAVSGEFLDWIGGGRRAPFFAFMNLFDAHDPYIAPDRPGCELPTASFSRADLLMLRDWHKLNKKSLDSSRIALARRAYDDCILSLDRELGGLVEELKRRGLYERTMLIITADHGEQFGEHGQFGHGLSLYQDEVHVPLLVVYPPGVPAGMVVSEPVSLRNLPATIVDVIGARSGSPFPGRSLAATWREPAADHGRSCSTAFSELDAPIDNSGRAPLSGASLGSMHSVAFGSHVYIRHGGGDEELFDLASDPAESRDLTSSSKATPILDRCRLILDQLLAR